MPNLSLHTPHRQAENSFHRSGQRRFRPGRGRCPVPPVEKGGI